MPQQLSSRALSRRGLLKLGLGAGLAAPLGFVSRRSRASTSQARVVIAGGGFGGAGIAAALRRRAPEAEVVLIDPWPSFYSAALSIDYVLGQIELAEVERSYAALEAAGVRRVEGRLRDVDLSGRVAETDQEDLPYSVLVLATGIELKPGAIPGLAEAGDDNLSLYDRASLAALREAIGLFDGGRIVISIPDGALKCPPAPYEFALMLARKIKAEGLDGEVMLLDAWPSPQPDALGDALAAALEAEADVLTYLPAEPVAEIDADSGVVITDFGDELDYDLLSVIPPNGASELLQALDLTMPGDAFAEVDPITMKSARQEGVYVIGDAARTPYGRTAASAAAGAELAAAAIAAELAGESAPDGPVLVDTACYPFVELDRAMRLSVRFSAERANGEMAIASEVEADGEASAANAAARRSWERGLLERMFAEAAE